VPCVAVAMCRFVQDCEEGSYDAIIVDSSDPVGPAEVLFQQVSMMGDIGTWEYGGTVVTHGPPGTHASYFCSQQHAMMHRLLGVRWGRGGPCVVTDVPLYH
jgi:spermidine synthase